MSEKERKIREIYLEERKANEIYLEGKGEQKKR
jgi:hypothetical protein